MNSTFALDKANAKILGVCAGLARMTDTGPFLIRLVTVVAGLVAAPVVVILYFVTAWIAPDQA